MRWHKRFEGGVPWRRGVSGSRWLLWLAPAARQKEGGGEAQWNQREMADKQVSLERGEGGIGGSDSKFGESGDTLATAGGQVSLGS
jgi:hypothetical protein